MEVLKNLESYIPQPDKAGLDPRARAKEELSAHDLSKLEASQEFLSVIREMDFFTASQEQPDSTDSEVLYVWEMNRFPRLSEEEVKSLFRTMRSDREEEAWEARNRLIVCNLRLSASWAKKFASNRKGIFMDLVQQANLALIRSVDNFNLDLGNKFSTYATMAIKKELDEYLLESGEIRIPAKVNRMAKRVVVQEENIYQQTGGKDESLIAEKLGISKEKVTGLKNFPKVVISTDNQVGDEEGTSLHELITDPDLQISPETVFETKDLWRQFGEEMDLNGLTKKEKTAMVLWLIFKINDKVGEIMGVSRQAVNEFLQKGRKKLNNPGTREALEGF